MRLATDCPIRCGGICLCGRFPVHLPGEEMKREDVAMRNTTLEGGEKTKKSKMPQLIVRLLHRARACFATQETVTLREGEMPTSSHSWVVPRGLNTEGEGGRRDLTVA